MPEGKQSPAEYKYIPAFAWLGNAKHAGRKVEEISLLSLHTQHTVQARA